VRAHLPHQRAGVAAHHSPGVSHYRGVPHSRCSARTIYLRYASVHWRLPDEGPISLALMAWTASVWSLVRDSNEIIAIVRTTAEPGRQSRYTRKPVEIWQDQGGGAEPTRRLIDSTQTKGSSSFYAP